MNSSALGDEKLLPQMAWVGVVFCEIHATQEEEVTRLSELYDFVRLSRGRI